MSEIPEALRLADALESGDTHDAGSSGVVYGWALDDPTSEAAAELRRLHHVNERLKGLLLDILNDAQTSHWHRDINEALQEPPR